METRSCNKYIFITFQFKSYYVVWKLSELEVTKDEYEGLNRTM